MPHGIRKAAHSTTAPFECAAHVLFWRLLSSARQLSDLLAKHLRLWATSEFAWGRSDCAIVLADYVLDLTGRDGANHLRGQYTTKAGCNRVSGFIRRGLAVVVGECAAKVGLPLCEAPQRGDIGVLQFTERVFAGGICLGGGRWAVKSPDGLLTPTNPNVVAAWAVRG